MRLKPRNIKRLMFACTQCSQCIDTCDTVQRNNPKAVRWVDRRPTGAAGRWLAKGCWPANRPDGSAQIADGDRCGSHPAGSEENTMLATEFADAENQALERAERMR